MGAGDLASKLDELERRNADIEARAQVSVKAAEEALKAKVNPELIHSNKSRTELCYTAMKKCNT